MDPIARSRFPDFLLECGEGAANWMYLDQADPPNVTTGRGNMLATLHDAMILDWRKPDNSPASPQDIQVAWLRVKTQPHLARQGGGAFASLTSIRATKASIDALIQSRIDLFDAELREDWPGWDTSPSPAQKALMRLAWACGGRLASRWPRLHTAWVARNWAECARQCRIPALDGTEPGANDLEAALFRACLGPDTNAPGA